VINAVNMPSIDEQTLAVVGPYLRFAQSLGRLAALLGPAQADSFRVEYSGKISEQDTTLVTRAALAGFLSQAFDAHALNYLNAPAHAKKLGLQVVDSKNPHQVDFSELIEIQVVSGEQSATLAGTFFGGRARVVKVNAYHVECQPDGHILLVENNDTPGIIGLIGTLLARHGVNIADMALARNAAGATAIAVLNLDSAPGDAVLDALRADPNILTVRSIFV
jgi:D-3-phosphoglycerate dehydrogenase / 2-oxoglutarate reductase